MATFIGNASVDQIRPGFVANGVTANPVGGRPGAGDYVLDGRGGQDIMDGGDGNDTYVVDNLGDTATEANDTVEASVDHTLSAALENLELTGLGDIDGTGNGDGNVVTGNSRDNVLSGRGGADTLIGGGGRDTLLGGSGADDLDGGSGADDMDGGSGDDEYHVNNLGDVPAETSNTGAAGFDTVFASAGHTLGFGMENLTQEGAGNISGEGNGNDNVIRGNDGANTLSGLEGDDILRGGESNDTLLGGLDDDTLRGEDGADTLQGGAETDILIGGIGADVFDFNVAGHSTGLGRDVTRGGDGAVAFQSVGGGAGDRIDPSASTRTPRPEASKTLASAEPPVRPASVVSRSWTTGG